MDFMEFMKFAMLTKLLARDTDFEMERQIFEGIAWELGEEYECSDCYQEILRLRDMLDAAEIPYALHRRLDGWHLIYMGEGGKTVCSIIEHKNSYGHEDDTLEVSGLIVGPVGAEVKGGVSAEEAFAAIEQHWLQR